MGEENLQHHGVKGMRWGVRKDSRPGVRAKLGSLKRERQWKKVIGQMDKLTNEELAYVAKRVGLENDLKRLTKKRTIAGPDDKADYINRAKLDDEELSRKVTRLRAKDNLVNKINDASKEQREFGEKVVNIGSGLAMKYATQKSLSPKDIFETVTKPKEVDVKDKMLKEFVDDVDRRYKERYE